MSLSQTPRSAGQPKQMSSRLLTMKFMQRPAISSPLTALSASTQTSQNTNERSAKRQRLSESTPTSTPISSASGMSTPNIPSEPAFADRTAISAALKAEAESRAIARARTLREGDEEEWILEFTPPQPNGHIHMNGHSNSQLQSQNIDDVVENNDEVDDDIWKPSSIRGRQTYGAFKRRTATITTDPETTNTEDLSAASSDKEDSSLTHLYSPSTPGTPGTKSSSKKHRRANSLDEEREGRRMDNLDLKGMSGISGGATGTPKLKNYRRKKRKTG